MHNVHVSASIDLHDCIVHGGLALVTGLALSSFEYRVLVTTKTKLNSVA
jgi:hypothetical protein